MTTEKVVAQQRDALMAAARTVVPVAEVPAPVAAHLADVEGVQRTFRKLTVGGAAYFEVLVTDEGKDPATGRLESATSGALLDASGKELAYLDAVDGVAVFARSPAEQAHDKALGVFLTKALGVDPRANAALAQHELPVPSELQDEGEDPSTVRAFAFEFEGGRYLAKLVLGDEDDSSVTIFDAQHRPLGAYSPGDGALVVQEVGDARPWKYGAGAPRDEFAAGAAAPKPVAPPAGRSALRALATKR